MRALICPYSVGHTWCDYFFPDRSICSLPVVGKAIIEHILDVCMFFKMRRVKILDYCYDSALHANLGENRDSMRLTYSGANLNSDFAGMLTKNRSFMLKEKTMIFWGAVLPDVSSHEQLISDLEPVTATKTMPDGIYIYEHGELMRSKVPLFRFRSIRDYFEINMAIIENPRIYVLPGYSVEAGVYVGTNVIIERGCEITPSVVLSDNVSLGENCHLGGGVIMGRNVFVGAGSEIRRSCILEINFIGTDFDLSEKIVVANRIIDPMSRVFIEHENSGLSGDIEESPCVALCNITEYLLALFLAVFFLLPWIFFTLLEWLWRPTLWGYKWSVDRYLKYWKVLFGRFRLIKWAHDDRNYVFKISESFSYPHSKEQEMLDELYYQNHRTPGAILQITLKSVVNRWFVNEIP